MYKIPCPGMSRYSNEKYVGETCINFDKRIY